jgi:hypothetical protein
MPLASRLSTITIAARSLTRIIPITSSNPDDENIITKGPASNIHIVSKIGERKDVF